jgi:hypothetical protein
MIDVTRLKKFGDPQWLLFRDSGMRDGKEVGSILISEIGKMAIIIFMWVWPKQRRKGYATMMVKYLQGESHDGILITEPDFKGYDVLATQWSASIPASRQLLKKLGFIKKEDRLEWSRLETVSSTVQE